MLCKSRYFVVFLRLIYCMWSLKKLIKGEVAQKCMKKPCRSFKNNKKTFNFEFEFFREHGSCMKLYNCAKFNFWNTFEFSVIFFKINFKMLNLQGFWTKTNGFGNKLFEPYSKSRSTCWISKVAKNSKIGPQYFRWDN